MRSVLQAFALATATVGSAFAVAAFACSGQDSVAQSGEAAKDFSAMGSDGKTHTLASLTEGGKTLVLYFVKNGCGANPRAVPLFRKVSDPFQKSDKVNFMVVFNDGKAPFDAFEKEYGVGFRGLLDPEYAVIKAYGVKNSQGSIVIQDGKILKRWKGFNRASLTELGEIMAKAEGTKFEVDLSGAPERESFG